MKINLFNYTITIKKKKRKQTKKSYGKFGLDAPVAPDGYRHRWIRQETLGAPSIKKSAFKLVKAREYNLPFTVVDETTVIGKEPGLYMVEDKIFRVDENGQAKQIA